MSIACTLMKNVAFILDPGSRQARPLSASKKHISNSQDPDHSAYQVINAMRQENEAVLRANSRQTVSLPLAVKINTNIKQLS